MLGLENEDVNRNKDIIKTRLSLFIREFLMMFSF